MPEVIIPAYNEEQTIAHVVQAVREAGLRCVVVSDGSRDFTCRYACDAGADVIPRTVNSGKTSAIWCGLKQTTDPEIILLDADLLGLSPDHIDQLVAVYEGGLHFDQVCARIARQTGGLAGQRIAHRQFWELVCDESSGWDFEVVANRKARNTAWVQWPDVTHRQKIEKYGAVEGIVSQVKMFRKVIFGF